MNSRRRRLDWLGLCALSVLSVVGGAAAQDVMRGHGGPVRALAIAQPAEARLLVSGGFDTAVIVWDIASGGAARVLRFHEGAVNAVAALPGGCMASGGEDRRIAVWCGAGEAPAHVLQGHEAPVTSLAVLEGGRRLASGSFDGTVRMWTVADGRLERTLAEHKGPVTALAAEPDGGGVISAGPDGLLRTRLDAAAGPGDRFALSAPVTALAVAQDGEIVAASADGHVRLVSPALALAAEIEVDRIPLASLALSPDGRLVAAAGLRGGIAVIDRGARIARHRLTGPGLPVWSLAFDTDSRTLFTGGADRVIRRWDAATGTALTSSLPEPGETGEAGDRPERGAAVFRACQACHTLTPDGGNRAGPTLHGVFGRRIATAGGYQFSEALKGMDIVWTAETISRLFEIGPSAYTPGTKMPEQTISDPADRKALVDWLERQTRTR